MKYSYFTLRSSELGGIQLPAGDWLPLNLPYLSVHLYRFPPHPNFFPTPAPARGPPGRPWAALPPDFCPFEGPSLTLHSKALASDADYPVREPARGPPVPPVSSGTFPQQRRLARTRSSKVLHSVSAVIDGTTGSSSILYIPIRKRMAVSTLDSWRRPGPAERPRGLILGRYLTVPISPRFILYRVPSSKSFQCGVLRPAASGQRSQSFCPFCY
ncbi:hypothetical protein Landi51_03449 [Colletotrichum acutatum]